MVADVADGLLAGKKVNLFCSSPTPPPTKGELRNRIFGKNPVSGPANHLPATKKERSATIPQLKKTTNPLTQQQPIRYIRVQYRCQPNH